MIFLFIYVCTILFALSALVLLSIETVLYVKEHGLVSARKISISRRLFEWLKLLLQCVIPLYNIFFGLCCLIPVLSETYFVNAIQDGIEKGNITHKGAE